MCCLSSDFERSLMSKEEIDEIRDEFFRKDLFEFFQAAYRSPFVDSMQVSSAYACNQVPELRSTSIPASSTSDKRKSVNKHPEPITRRFETSRMAE